MTSFARQSVGFYQSWRTWTSSLLITTKHERYQWILSPKLHPEPAAGLCIGDQWRRQARVGEHSCLALLGAMQVSSRKAETNWKAESITSHPWRYRHKPQLCLIPDVFAIVNWSLLMLIWVLLHIFLGYVLDRFSSLEIWKQETIVKHRFLYSTNLVPSNVDLFFIYTFSAFQVYCLFAIS